MSENPEIKKFELNGPKIGVVGIGGAGGNAVNHLIQEEFTRVKFINLNTDLQALEQSPCRDSVQLGAQRTRGLGTGGDPEVGRLAAEDDLDSIREAVKGFDILFIIAGMGGGTGTGAAPIIARVAKETGALVLAFAILPFASEGARRMRQAQGGLIQLKEEADGVILMPNQNIFGLIEKEASFIEAFNVVNGLLGKGIRGFWKILYFPGLINLDFADLASVLRGRHSESHFAAVTVDGGDLAAQALENLNDSPSFKGGDALKDAEAVLVNLVGGEDLSMSVVDKVMTGISSQCDHAQMIIGASFDPECFGKLEVTVIASCSVQTPAESYNPFVKRHEPRSVIESDGNSSGTSQNSESPVIKMDTEFFKIAQRSTEKPGLFTSFGTPLHSAGKPSTAAKSESRKGKLLPGQLPLDVISKARFQDVEPTFHQGEDLDVPTFVRRGIKLN